MYRTVLFAVILAASSFLNPCYSQCSPDEVTVTFDLQSDYYGYETSWAALYIEDFDFSFSKYFNCAPGFSCDDAFSITDYDFALDASETWYTLSVPEIGQYQISTCDNPDDCNTTIYVYAECPIASEDTVEGTLFYNDKNEECGELALAVSALDVDREYTIRIKRWG